MKKVKLMFLLVVIILLSVFACRGKPEGFSLTIEIDSGIDSGSVEVKNNDKILSYNKGNSYIVPSGSILSLTAIPNNNYDFDGWFGSVLDDESLTTSIRVSKDETIKVFFIKDCFTTFHSPEDVLSEDLIGGISYTYPILKDELIYDDEAPPIIDYKDLTEKDIDPNGIGVIELPKEEGKDSQYISTTEYLNSVNQCRRYFANKNIDVDKDERFDTGEGLELAKLSQNYETKSFSFSYRNKGDDNKDSFYKHEKEVSGNKYFGSSYEYTLSVHRHSNTEKVGFTYLAKGEVNGRLMKRNFQILSANINGDVNVEASTYNCYIKSLWNKIASDTGDSTKKIRGKLFHKDYKWSSFDESYKTSIPIGILKLDFAIGARGGIGTEVGVSTEVSNKRLLEVIIRPYANLVAYAEGGVSASVYVAEVGGGVSGQIKFIDISLPINFYLTTKKLGGSIDIDYDLLSGNIRAYAYFKYLEVFKSILHLKKKWRTKRYYVTLFDWKGYKGKKVLYKGDYQFSDDIRPKPIMNMSLKDSNTTKITLENNKIAFEDTPLGGQSNLESFRISNQGQEPLNIENVVIMSNEFKITNEFIQSDGTFLPLVVNPGEEKDIDFYFIPKCKGQRYSDVTIISNDSHNPEFKLCLEGRSLYPEFNIIDLSIGSGLFGGQVKYFSDVLENSTWLPETLSYRITNIGDYKLLLDDITLTPELSSPTNDDFSYELDKTIIEPGEEAILRVTFSPKENGIKVYKIRVMHNDITSGDGVFTFNVVGRYVKPKLMVIADDFVMDDSHTLFYGDVQINTEVKRNVIFKNVGGCELDINFSRFDSDGNSYSVVGGVPNSPRTLFFGEEINLDVVYHPEAVAENNASMKVTHNDIITYPDGDFDVNFHGKGVLLNVSVVDGQGNNVAHHGIIDFPYTKMNTPVSLSYIVTNIGNSQLDTNSVTNLLGLDSDQFTFSYDKSILSIDEETRLILTFNPTNSTNNKSVTINIDGYQATLRGMLDKIVYNSNFSQSFIENKIRSIINKPAGEIYRSDLVDVYRISINNRNLIEIGELKNLVNLLEVRLNNDNITDISSLKFLKRLSSVILDYNGSIQDFSVLSEFKETRVLSLSSCNLQSLSFLEDLYKIEYIDLSNNTSINSEVPSKIGGLLNLSVLKLSNTGLTDIGFLLSNTSIKTLNLDNNNIQDISVLKHLPKLIKVNINNNSLNLTVGSPNRVILDSLISNGVEIIYEQGNTL